MIGPIIKYEGEAGREWFDPDLDEPYIAAVGYDIAHAIGRGDAVEVAYQPGDGTRYALVFVPLHLDLATARARVVDGREWDRRAVSGIGRRDEDGAWSYDHNGVLVCQVEGVCYPFILGSGTDLSVDYVGEKLGLSSVSAGSVALLLRAIAWYRADETHPEPLYGVETEDPSVSVT